MEGAVTRKSTAVRREEIVDAALAVLADPVNGRFSTRRLAEAVGLTEGAIFRHFPTLDAILLAAVDRVERLLFDGFPPTDADPIDRVGAFFRARARTLVEHPDVPRLLHSDALLRTAGEPAAKRLESARRRSQAFLRSAFREAGETGALAPEVPVEVAVLIVTGAVLALARQRGGGPDAETVWKVLERALRAGRR